jgi:hypothetical protein
VKVGGEAAVVHRTAPNGSVQTVRDEGFGNLGVAAKRRAVESGAF